jgi:dedicator of cytokinesis protein 3
VKRQARDLTEELWLEKVYFTTEETFPTVLRRSQVVALEVVGISPVEHALSEVEKKTKDLASMNLRFQSLAKTGHQVSTNQLSMALNSAVDAPLDTGIASYREIFFNPDYVARHPDRADLVERLKVAVDEQVRPHLNSYPQFTDPCLAFLFKVRVIDDCLKLHGVLCPPEFAPFHETLEKFFRKNFREEIRRLGLDDSPLSPSIVRVTSQYEQSMIRSISSSNASSSTTRPFLIPPLQLGKPILTPPPQSPRSSETPADILLPSVKQTALQQHLANLVRNGINGVATPGETSNGTSSYPSAESPHNSIVNVGGSGINGINGTPSAQSVHNSTLGSLGSFGSLRERLSRLGSLNFGRRGPNHS